MFNNISNNVYEEICNMLFKYHNLIISSYKQLNKLYNACYCPKSIKTDILDILQQDVYICEIDLEKMGF